VRTHLLVRFALVIAVLLGAALGAHAQETQVPFDQSGKVMLVDKALESRLGLFPEYDGFEEARLFQVSDSTYNLEVMFRLGDKLQKATTPLSADDVAALRARVTVAIRAQAPEVGLDQSGRSAFLISAGLLSLGYYGWAVPYLLHIDSGSAYGGAYMLTSGLGFFGPFLLTRHRSVTDGEATLGLYGATRGMLHGWCVSVLASGPERETRDTVAWMTVTSLAEYTAGFMTADRARMSAGTAEAVSAVGDFGLMLGWWASWLADDENDKLEAGGMLVGTGVGLASGGLLARSQHYTRGDAYVLRAAGTLGAYMAMAASASVSKDDKAAVISTMTGAVGGLAVGHHLLRGKDFSTGQGVIIGLSEVAGGLFGTGLLLATGTDTDPAWPYLLASSGGALAGFWLTYHSLGARASTHGGKSSELRLDISPEGLLALRGGRSGHRTSVPAGQAVPLVKLEYRF
jgi:hypothetical protein